MTRLLSLAIPFALLALAAAAAALARFALGLEPWTSFALGLAVLFVGFLLHTTLQRGSEQRQFRQRLEGLSQLEEMLARTLQTLPGRVTALEERVARRFEREPPGAAEIARLELALQQLGQSVQAVEQRLDRLRPVPVERPPQDPAPRAAEAAKAEPPAAPPAVPAPERRPEIDPAGRVVRAIEAERIELYLQPIITLPQRRPRFYDASVQLRDEAGHLIHAADVVPRADRAGLASRLDSLILFRAVQVLRRLAVQQRETALFCSISARTFAEPAAFADFLAFAEANRPVVEALVLVLPQRAVHTFRDAELDHLAALRRIGCRFCLGDVSDLRLDPARLNELGFRFVRISSSVILDRTGAARAGVAAADLSDQLARAGIDLICERVSSEAMVVDLLDHDVRLAQGDLFARPRPVRPEIMGAAGAA